MATDVLDVATLPLQNTITIVTTTANLFTIVVITPNNVYKAIVSGQADQVPKLIQYGIAAETAAIRAFVQLPATIIATDVAAVTQLLGNFGSSGAAAPSTFATANAPALTANASAAAAAPSGLVGLTNVATLPLQNAITIATATANLFTIVVTTPNNVYKLIVSGQADQVPKAIQDGITAEAAAIQTFVKLPATIIATDVAAIAGLFGGLGGAPAASMVATTNPPALKTAARTIGTPVLTSAVDDPFASEISTASNTFTVELPKALSAGKDWATSTARIVTRGAISPDATENKDETTTAVSRQPADVLAHLTDKLAPTTKDSTTSGAHSNDDTATAGASSVNTNGTGHQATSTPNTEGGQDVSNTTNRNTLGGRHRASDTTSKRTSSNAPGRHRADDSASGSNAGTSAASSSEAGSMAK